MPSLVRTLRLWIAMAAVVLLLVIGGFYAYARWRIHTVVQDLPAKLTKLGVDIKQTADSFSVSKSEQGRTIFTARANKAVQLKDGGRVELHNVVITVYGREAARYDQISGADFEYDPHTGDISARGPVTIDLVANPRGLLNPDQAPPQDLKEPLHVRTSGLVFNQKSGNGFTHDKVEFSMATASGEAGGASYDSRSGQLTLEHGIQIATLAPSAASVSAASGLITKSPPQILLTQVHLTHGPQQVEADKATVFLTDTNTIDRVWGEGNVRLVASGRTHITVNSDQAEILLAGEKAELRRAVVSGHVHVVTSGMQNTEAFADRTILDFAEGKVLSKARAEGNARMMQKSAVTPGASSGAGNPQEVAIAAPAIDFFTKNGRLATARTSGAAAITISPAASGSASSTSPQSTRVTADQFTAEIDTSNHLRSLHGSPNAVITSLTPGQPDRVSTSTSLDVAFRTSGGIESIVQRGDLRYHDGQRDASAEQGVFSPSNRQIVLTGAPRVAGQGLTTTASVIRLNRESGEAVAEGDVKSTYSELKPQANGALLASSDPIHVTAQSMHARKDSGVAQYSGGVRLWQGPNVVQAATIDFDRDRRSMRATGKGSAANAVTTVLVQTGADGKTTLVTITSQQLAYTDSERRIQFDGGVTMRNSDVNIGAKSLDVYLAPAGQTTSNQTVRASAATPGRLEKAVASGTVTVTQLNRHATGDKLAYFAAEDKFTLTGGPPSIFDAERGQITGDSLTFFRHDDRVLVEGKANSPVITKTRVAH